MLYNFKANCHYMPRVVDIFHNESFANVIIPPHCLENERETSAFKTMGSH